MNSHELYAHRCKWVEYGRQIFIESRDSANIWRNKEERLTTAVMVWRTTRHGVASLVLRQEEGGFLRCVPPQCRRLGPRPPLAKVTTVGEQQLEAADFVTVLSQRLRRLSRVVPVLPVVGAGKDGRRQADSKCVSAHGGGRAQRHPHQEGKQCCQDRARRQGQLGNHPKYICDGGAGHLSVSASAIAAVAAAAWLPSSQRRCLCCVRQLKPCRTTRGKYALLPEPVLEGSSCHVRVLALVQAGIGALLRTLHQELAEEALEAVLARHTENSFGCQAPQVCDPTDSMQDDWVRNYILHLVAAQLWLAS